MWPTCGNVCSNYSISQQSVNNSGNICAPSDIRVFAVFAEYPNFFTPQEFKTILKKNSVIYSHPGQPRDLSGTADTTTIVLRWTAPSNGGTPITSYTVSWGNGSQEVLVNMATITYLLPNTSYTFKVIARNAVGKGPASAPFTFTTSILTNYAWSLSTYAGGGALLEPFNGYSDGSGVYAQFSRPQGVAIDSSGNIYVADSSNNRIRKIDSTGLVTTIAGDGTFDFADDQGTNAKFAYPYSVATDSNGNIYVADTNNYRIRKIDLNGYVTTIAGSTYGYGTGVGTNAQFLNPNGIAADSSGNIYVVDTGNIRKIDSTFYVTTIAQFINIGGITTDSNGNIYVADFYNHQIQKIDSSMNITTIAGDGENGFLDASGTNAKFGSPQGITTDSNGNIYVIDIYYSDIVYGRIRKIDSTGDVTTIAGSTKGYATGVGTNAQFAYPNGVAIDSSGNIYVADTENNLIRAIDSSMNVTSIGGACNVPNQLGYGTGLGTNVRFSYPNGVTTDSNGNIYVGDTVNNRIRKIDSNGVVTTIAGDGTYDFADDQGTNAKFRNPNGIATDSSGNIYVADSANNLIRMIDSSMNVTTIAGDGEYGYGTGVGTNAQFNYPFGVAIDSSGNIYVADSGNHLIRMIDSSMNVTTIAGDGTYGYGTGVGTNARFAYPNGVAIDLSGNIYVPDIENNRIRKIDSSMNVTTIAGDGTGGYGTGVGTNTQFAYPNGVTIDSSGNIYVADSNNNVIRKIDSSMNVTTLVGGGPNSTNKGSINGVGTNAMLNYPGGIALDGNGNIYVADSGNNTIKKLVLNLSI